MADSTIDTKETDNVEKYDGINFQMWKIHMQFIFQSKDIWSIVNDTDKKNSAIDQAAWEKKDKTAAVAILNAINRQHNEEVANCKTSVEMWKQLVAVHEKNSEECIIALQERFYKCQLEENESMISYITKL